MPGMISEEAEIALEQAEILDEAKQRAQKIIDAEVADENANTPWYKKVFGFAKKLFIRVASVICGGVRDTVVFIINNEQNQTLAKLAVLTAMEAGLKGENAFQAAWRVLHEGRIYISETQSVDPSHISTNIKQTLIQLVYTCIKNRISPLALPKRV